YPYMGPAGESVVATLPAPAENQMDSFRVLSRDRQLRAIRGPQQDRFAPGFLVQPDQLTFDSLLGPPQGDPPQNRHLPTPETPKVPRLRQRPLHSRRRDLEDIPL